MENDEVNHPVHYTSHPSGVECADIAEHYDFCIGNVIKYVWRAGLKTVGIENSTEAELRDLRKAKWYIERKIAQLERKIKNENGN